MNAKRPSLRPLCSVRHSASSPSSETCVALWFSAKTGDAPSPPGIAELLVEGLNALWERARPSLGDPTLAVLFNRAFLANRHERLVRGLALHVSRRSCIAR